MPTELDQIIRRIRQLEIERVALDKETDDASRERLERLERELAELGEQRDGMTAHWQQEKASIDTLRQLQGGAGPRAADEAARLERDGDLGRRRGHPLRRAARPRAPDRAGQRGAVQAAGRDSAS